MGLFYLRVSAILPCPFGAAFQHGHSPLTSNFYILILKAPFLIVKLEGKCKYSCFVYSKKWPY